MTSMVSILGYVAMGASALAMAAAVLIARKAMKNSQRNGEEQPASPSWFIVRYGKSGYVGGEFIDITEEDAR